MKSEWKKCKLGDLITFQRGHDLPKYKMQLDGQYPVVGSNGIIGYNDEYTTNPPCITVGRSGNVGKPFLVNTKSWSHNTTLYVKEFKNVDPIFIYYFLKTLHLENYAGGSAVPTLNRNHIHTLDVCVPSSKDTQKKIASILSVLDNKIEVNKKINENLEEQEQAIFKSWFVDFEPFKDSEFVNSELGQIPKGWKVDTLGSIINISSGKRPLSKINEKTEDYNIPVIGASGVMAYTNNVLTDEKIIVTGRVGTHGVVQKYYKPVWVSDNAFIIKSQYYEFVYQNFKNIDYSSLNRGSTQPLITQTDLKNTLIVIPPEKYLKEFENLISSYFVQSQKLNNENQVLIQIRDTLLPKLMNGEIDVNGN